ncbi:hypothetical protein EV687_0761 [Corticibacter populi]|nr:hypothetical protein EV687_0761 [Corticibacter populi]
MNPVVQAQWKSLLGWRGNVAREKIANRLSEIACL